MQSKTPITFEHITRAPHSHGRKAEQIVHELRVCLGTNVDDDTGARKHYGVVTLEIKQADGMGNLSWQWLTDAKREAIRLSPDDVILGMLNAQEKLHAEELASLQSAWTVSHIQGTETP